jgi:hypothetical protein
MTEIQEQFRREALALGFRYRCRDCGHRDPAGESFSLGYPNGMLRDPRLRSVDESGRFVFCKYFELDGP